MSIKPKMFLLALVITVCVSASDAAHHQLPDNPRRT